MSKKIFSLALAVMLLALRVPAVAQQVGKIPRIGFLFSGDLSEASARIEAFRQGLRELGYVEGKNIVIEQRSSGEKPDILSNLAGELVSLKVATIVTMGTEPTQAAKDATGTIPIVMTYVSDPIGFGFVASLARPGGNITGLTNLGPELSGKRLELLKEVLPQTSRVIVLLSPGNPIHTFLLKEMQVPAGALGIKLLSLELRGRSPKQVDEAFGTLKYSHSDALMVLPPPFNSLAMKRIVELAVKKRLPTTYHWKEYVEAGGLMYYGANLPDMYRRAAAYVDKILKGTKPAELPVEQPKKFEFIINLKAAKQIGLTIPPNVLARADKVIK
jgi:putative tryptophan/tyrosine transport system substrate-binding protein